MKKKAVWLLFIAAFMLSISTVFAQTNESAVSAQDEQSVQSIQNTVKIQKVIDIRKVVVYGSASQSIASKSLADDANQIQKTEATEKLQYDAKGGVIVPNASKGIKITPQSSQTAKIQKAQKQSSDEEESLQSGDKQQRNRKDLTSRKAKSPVETKKQKDN